MGVALFVVGVILSGAAVIGFIPIMKRLHALHRPFLAYVVMILIIFFDGWIGIGFIRFAFVRVVFTPPFTETIANILGAGILACLLFPLITVIPRLWGGHPWLLPLTRRKKA